MAIKYKQYQGTGLAQTYTANNNVVSKIIFYASGGEITLYPGIGAYPASGTGIGLVDWDNNSNNAGPNGGIGNFTNYSGSYNGSNIVYLAPNDQLVWTDNNTHRLTLIIFEESASQA